MVQKAGTLKQNDMKKIESFELWVWRRMLQVDWKDRKTNVWIRKRVGVSEEEGLLCPVKKEEAVYVWTLEALIR